MSEFVGLTPSLRVVLRNPLLKKKYPNEGTILSVVDTGYEGFVAVPPDVFEALSLSELRRANRELVLSNGERLGSEGAYGSFLVPEASVGGEGFIETYEGLREVLIGLEALGRTRAVLDYCQRRFGIQPCP